MSYDRYLAAQRKGVNVVFVVFISLIAFMWTATLIDWALDCRWGWDRQTLWLGPPMALFAVLLRLCAMAVFKFVGGNA